MARFARSSLANFLTPLRGAQEKILLKKQEVTKHKALLDKVFERDQVPFNNRIYKI
jgi:hypothetical protein